MKKQFLKTAEFISYFEREGMKGGMILRNETVAKDKQQELINPVPSIHEANQLAINYQPN